MKRSFRTLSGYANDLPSMFNISIADSIAESSQIADAKVSSDSLGSQEMKVDVVASPIRSEKSPQYKRPEKLKRHNSTGTIYVETTISRQDDKATIKCICTVIRAHMFRAASDAPLSPILDIFKDIQSNPMTADCKDSSPIERTDIPTLDAIINFFNSIFNKSQMESEFIIVTLVYCERVMTVTAGRLTLRHDNWRSILFACMIMASKVWDDMSMWNGDFSHLCPSFDLGRVNALECAMLELLQYEVRVSAGEYAKYYFHIRSLMQKIGYADSELMSLIPLNHEKAQKLKLSTEKYTMFTERSRVQSCHDLLSLTATLGQTNGHRLPSVGLEHLMHATHIDADGDVHTSTFRRADAKAARTDIRRARATFDAQGSFRDDSKGTPSFASGGHSPTSFASGAHSPTPTHHSSTQPGRGRRMAIDRPSYPI